VITSGATVFTLYPLETALAGNAIADREYSNKIKTKMILIDLCICENFLYDKKKVSVYTAYAE
jgi:hypothetical protein